MSTSKRVGDFNLTVKTGVLDSTVSSLSIWSMKLNQELYNTGLQKNNMIHSTYNKLNSSSKINGYLHQKIKLQPTQWRNKVW